MLFRCKKVDSPLCSYRNEVEETPLHLFHSCLKTKQLWNKLRQYLSQFINIHHSTPQSSILGIFDNNQHSELINHLLLIFKFYIYGTRNTKQLSFDHLKITINRIKEIEKELTSSSKLKLLKKWHPMKREGTGSMKFHLVLFIFFILFSFVFPVLSSFINFTFDSYVISYVMYFVIIERKKNIYIYICIFLCDFSSRKFL